MLSILIESPWIAGVVALALWALWRRRRQKVFLAAAVAWALYCGYEYLMYARVLCSGECNIRIDLLALYPLLSTLALLAVLQSVRSVTAATSMQPHDT